MTIQRRSFLTGTGALTLSGLAASASQAATPAVSASGGYSAQLVVVGGGPAGVCAAIAAARNGADVLLLEQGGCLGGMATQGLVNPFMTCYDKTGETMIIRGLFEEVVDRLVACGGAIHPRDCRAGTAFTSWIKIGHDHCTPFEPESLKLVLDEMCREAGVKVLFHATFAEPLLDGGRITGLRILTKAGLETVRAKLVIDATGDADVAFRAGVTCELGDKAAGRIQPASMFFRIGNVEYAKVEADIQANINNFYRKDGVNYRSLHWRVTEAREHGDWPLKRVSIGLFRGVREDQWAINTSRIMGVDGTNPQSLSDAEAEGRRQVQIIFNFFRKYVPGCKDAILLSTASTLGIRETRHIFGDYRLTTDDVLNGSVPKDSILLASNSVDIHGRFGPLSNQYVTVQNGNWYGVPYRCLIPKGVENLLVAGRSVSATSEAAGAIRVMPPCMAMGQAAGTAAAIALRDNCSPREVDRTKLVATLRSQKAFLGAGA
ncbi:MAG: FAD-dependent oxidoreductase [Kiritimatiellae bacterium]|nr:FAD-dependent oxidoreductase [Kiritimatiellia bacterium]